MHELHIDFLSKKFLYRLKHAGMRKELIARAMGFKPIQVPVIIDATAGLGRDSFILAALGFNVIMLERSAIIHKTLAEGLARAQENIDIAPIVDRLSLVHADAIDWLPKHKRPNVIYLDPMFPARQKSALVKKEMVILQDLLGKDEDLEKLFQVALTCALDRVVIKRPRLAAITSGKKPNFTLTGSSSRFDVYITSSA